MLEFERVIFQDLHDNDALFVFAKGLSVDGVIVNFLKSYSDAGNLVLALNCNEASEMLIKELLKIEGVTNIYNSSSNLGERVHQYFLGGIHFVSTRILVMDLLKQRIPVDKITGIVVFQAHGVLESCQEAFALQLYRQNNRTGFIKAFSDKPEHFLYGYGHLERILRALYLKEVFLWPRFHKTIQGCLKQYPVSLLELHVEPQQNVTEAQMCILHIMNTLIKEIKNKNRNVELQEITVENCLTRSFYKLLELQLDPIWHQISLKTKQLITDLKTLQYFIRTLFNDHLITFYSLVNCCKQLDYAQASPWVLSDSGQKLLSVTKNMLFNSKNELHPESPTKWKTLIEVLQTEIMSEIKENSSLKNAKILILCHEIHSCNQIREVLLQGPEKYLFSSILQHKIRFEKVSQSFLSNDKQFLETSIKDSLEVDDLDESDRSHQELPSQNVDVIEEPENEAETETELRSVYFLTVSQNEEVDNVFFSSIEPFTQLDNLDLSNIAHEEPLIMIQAFDKHNANHEVNLRKTLREIQPNYIIMYHCNHMAIREIEVFKARNPDNFLRVYLLVYSKSVEEQSYLTELRREKQSFEYLIEKKSKMLLPANQIETLTDQEDYSKSDNTNPKPSILVDTREFRSELPVLLHKRGIRIEPLMLTVGDYILTPEICIERKSVSDLIGSLQSGRLFEQCKQMSRHYAKPMLLIEFDQNKSFHLMGGRYTMSGDATNYSIQEKLQLLTLHYPKLKLIWSPNPYASAQLLEELKVNKDEPNCDRALAAGGNEIDEDDKIINYNQKLFDFLEKLPGVSSKNIDDIMKSGVSLRHLLSMSVNDFKDNLKMNASDAEMLYNSLCKPFEK